MPIYAERMPVCMSARDPTGSRLCAQGEGLCTLHYFGWIKEQSFG